TGLLKSKIAHIRIDGHDADLTHLDTLNLARTEAMGITISMPDLLMHGSKLGWESWLHSLDLWASKGFLTQLIKRLIDEGFDIGITADHGNLESIGSGRVSEGVIAEKRGERVRVYPERILRDQAHASNATTSLPWDHNLPE